MLRTAFGTAVLAVLALTVQAQQGPAKPAVTAGKAIDTSGKAAIPIGPLLKGEERLTPQERAERTFLMPPRKKMPSVQPPAPVPDPTSTEAVAIAPAAEEAAEEAVAAKPTVGLHRSSVRRHRSSRHHSSTKLKTKKKSSPARKRRR